MSFKNDNKFIQERLNDSILDYIMMEINKLCTKLTTTAHREMYIYRREECLQKR